MIGGESHCATDRRAVLGAVVFFLFFFATTSANATCPNEAIRAEQGTTALPSCMALEMVSPPQKAVQPAFAPVFSPDGERIRFRSLAALAETPGLQMPFGDSYIGIRGTGGWQTHFTSPPTEANIVRGGGPAGGPYAYLPDFSRWVSFGVSQTEAGSGLLQLFRGGLENPFEPLTPLLVPADDSGASSIAFFAQESGSAGSARDLSVTLFRPPLASTAFLPGDPRGNTETQPGGDRNNYVAYLGEAGDPTVELLARDKDDLVYGGRCGTHLGGGIGGPRGTGRLNQGAISADGERIFFSTRPEQDEGVTCDPAANPLRIMVRSATPAGPEIEQLIPGGPAAGDDLYQGASVDGGLVYLTTTRALAGSDTDSGTKCSATPGASAGCDLYLYDASLPPSERLIQASAGQPGSPTPGAGAEVLSSITAISSDGSRAYFAAEGVLTTAANPEGDVPQAGEPNLYVYERGSGVEFIGTLSDEDEGRETGLWGGEQAYANDAAAVPFHGPPAGGDGHVFVFGSKAPLTDDDTDGGFRDVFRYDTVANTLERISKAAPGGSEVPASNMEMNPTPESDSPEVARWVSEDGLTVAFSSAEPLAPGDEDGLYNPYFSKGGEVTRLPGDDQVPTLAPTGTAIGFTTSAALLPAFDGDTATDVYIARTDGGFTPPVPPVLCNPLAGQCQGPPAPAPASSDPGSGTVGPPDQAQPQKQKPKKKKKKNKGKKKNSKKKKAGKNGRAGK